jgi:hypothetical protein
MAMLVRADFTRAEHHSDMLPDPWNKLPDHFVLQGWKWILFSLLTDYGRAQILHLKISSRSRESLKDVIKVKAFTSNRSHEVPNFSTPTQGFRVTG